MGLRINQIFKLWQEAVDIATSDKSTEKAWIPGQFNSWAGMTPDKASPTLRPGQRALYGDRPGRTSLARSGACQSDGSSRAEPIQAEDYLREVFGDDFLFGRGIDTFDIRARAALVEMLVIGIDPNDLIEFLNVYDRNDTERILRHIDILYERGWTLRQTWAEFFNNERLLSNEAHERSGADYEIIELAQFALSLPDESAYQLLPGRKIYLEPATMDLLPAFRPGQGADNPWTDHTQTKTEFDAILVTPNGRYVVEIKSFNRRGYVRPDIHRRRAINYQGQVLVAAGLQEGRNQSPGHRGIVYILSSRLGNIAPDFSQSLANVLARDNQSGVATRVVVRNRGRSGQSTFLPDDPSLQIILRDTGGAVRIPNRKAAGFTTTDERQIILAIPQAAPETDLQKALRIQDEIAKNVRLASAATVELVQRIDYRREMIETMMTGSSPRQSSAEIPEHLQHPVNEELYKKYLQSRSEYQKLKAQDPDSTEAQSAGTEVQKIVRRMATRIRSALIEEAATWGRRAIQLQIENATLLTTHTETGTDQRRVVLDEEIRLISDEYALNANRVNRYIGLVIREQDRAEKGLSFTQGLILLHEIFQAIQADSQIDLTNFEGSIPNTQTILALRTAAIAIAQNGFNNRVSSHLIDLIHNYFDDFVMLEEYREATIDIVLSIFYGDLFESNLKKARALLNQLGINERFQDLKPHQLITRLQTQIRLPIYQGLPNQMAYRRIITEAVHVTKFITDQEDPVTQDHERILLVISLFIETRLYELENLVFTVPEHVTDFINPDQETVRFVQNLGRAYSQNTRFQLRTSELLYRITGKKYLNSRRGVTVITQRHALEKVYNTAYLEHASKRQVRKVRAKRR